MKKMIFVFNPRSGKEQIRSKLPDIIFHRIEIAGHRLGRLRTDMKAVAAENALVLYDLCPSVFDHNCLYIAVTNTLIAVHAFAFLKINDPHLL